MKTTTSLGAAALLTLALASCDPSMLQTNSNAAADEARRQIEETRTAYEKQATDMEARSAQMQQQLADLQRSIQDKESADLKAKLDALEKENERLMADAVAARKKSDALREQLATTPAPAPYLPATPAPSGGGLPWTDPGADYSMFYEQLNPYGKWLDVEGYGYAWRPNLAERTNWRPYTDGRWAWSDQGWAWDSNEPFGWACYHYGRWVRISRHGWVWVPGREWAPAWVSWRSGGDHVGWAPLPPAPRNAYGNIGHDCDVSYGLAPSSYIFIEASNFARPSYLNVVLSVTNVTRIFQQTVNVTNIVQVNQQQTNFYMHRGGPRRDWVEERCGTRLPQAPVQIVRSLDRPGDFRPGRAGLHSFTAMQLPRAESGRRPVLPSTAERVVRPTIVDAWTEVPTDNRQVLREAISRQARAPQPTPVVSIAEIVPEPRPEVRPAIPLPTNPLPGTPGSTAGRDRRELRPGPQVMPPPVLPGTTAAAQAEAEALVLREAAARQATMNQQQAEAARREREGQARTAQMAQEQQELARKQAEATAMRQQIAETERKQAEMVRLQQEEAARLQVEAAAAAMKGRQVQPHPAAKDPRSAVFDRMRQRGQPTINPQEEAQAGAAAAAAQQQAAMQRQQQETAAAQARAAAAVQQQATMQRQQEESAAAQARAAAAAQQQAAMQRQQQETAAAQARAAVAAQQQAAARVAQEAAAARQRQAASTPAPVPPPAPAAAPPPAPAPAPATNPAQRLLEERRRSR